MVLTSPLSRNRNSDLEFLPTLSLFNPSDYWRKGHLSASWHPIYEKTKIPPENLVVYQSGKPIPSQVDIVDPDDPSRKTLVFSLTEEIPPEAESSVDIGQGGQIHREENEPSCIVCKGEDGKPKGVTLKNNRIILFFSLASEKDPDLPKCYAGAATSVQLDRQEMLDAFRTEQWMEHDAENRCMQIDCLKLWHPGWDNILCQEEQLFDRSYQLISQSSGPVRASITVASAPFYYQYTDLLAEQRHQLECRLYRVISLYADADYIVEELFVKGRPTDNMQKVEPINLYFTARYFSCMDLGFTPQKYQFPGIPDWFAVGWPYGDFGIFKQPHPGYGFATDIHADWLVSPDPRYPNKDKGYKTFCWELYPCKFAKCLHFFTWGNPAGFDDQAGRYWYELIYRPLRSQSLVFLN